MESNRKFKEDWDDIQNALGKVSHDFVPEQERNFDAGYSPSESKHKFIREEWIDGKLYKVWQ